MKRKKRKLLLAVAIGSFLLCLSLIIYITATGRWKSTEKYIENVFEKEHDTEQSTYAVSAGLQAFANGIQKDILPVNEYSRPGTKVEKINAVVIHYVGNPGTSAANNRKYYESLIETKQTKVSSHYIVGLNGEVIQCVPLDEVAYASNNRNSDTISVECCHPDETGAFNDATYQSMVKLAAYLCENYGLDPLGDGLIRHYDVTGKECPRYFVQHEDAWTQFKQDVKAQMQ